MTDELYELLEELRQLIKGNKQAELLLYKLSLKLEECTDDDKRNL